MLKRPSSRLLVLDDKRRLLLFRFEHAEGALAGTSFWATPGGGVEAGESFEEAGRRELLEEVGLDRSDIGIQVARRIASFRLPSGKMVESDERYFAVQAGRQQVSRENWTTLERKVMVAHRWWSHSDLLATNDQVWPENLPDMLIEAGVWTAAG